MIGELRLCIRYEIERCVSVTFIRFVLSCSVVEGGLRFSFRCTTRVYVHLFELVPTVVDRRQFEVVNTSDLPRLKRDTSVLVGQQSCNLLTVRVSAM